MRCPPPYLLPTQSFFRLFGRLIPLFSLPCRPKLPKLPFSIARGYCTLKVREDIASQIAALQTKLDALH